MRYLVLVSMLLVGGLSAAQPTELLVNGGFGDGLDPWWTTANVTPESES